MFVILVFFLTTVSVNFAVTNEPFLVKIPSSICNSNHQQASDEVINRAVLDEKHHIILSWTAKAACTKAVEMFWNGMHIYSGVYYPVHGRVHNYKHAFEASCGVVTKKMLYSSKYYKFKVVRNPYDRAVSSFLFLMKVQFAHVLFDKQRFPIVNNSSHPLNNLSFEELLQLYVDKILPLKLKFPSFINAADNHFKPQSTSDEVSWYDRHGKSLYNRIVHLENFDEDVSLVNKDTKMNYTDPDGYDNHVQVKVEDKVDMYVGNRNYSNLMSNRLISKSYGNFYNRKTKRLVEDIFADDLRLYGYQYPYSKVY